MAKRTLPSWLASRAPQAPLCLTSFDPIQLVLWVVLRVVSHHLLCLLCLW